MGQQSGHANSGHTDDIRLGYIPVGVCGGPDYKFIRGPCEYDRGYSPVQNRVEAYAREEDPASWPEHFIKGFASLGVLGFIKMFFSMSPFHWLNFRSGFWSTGGGRRGGTTGRDRAANISWVVLIVGVGTFLYVSASSRSSVDDHV